MVAPYQPTSYTLFYNGPVVLLYFAGTFESDLEPVLDRCLVEIKAVRYSLIVLSMKSVPMIPEHAVRPFRKFLHSIRHKDAKLRFCDLQPLVIKFLNDHSLARPEEIGGRLKDVMDVNILRLLLR